MFHSFTGTVNGKGSDFLLLSTGGIEWRLLMTTTSLHDTPSSGEECRVFVYLYHREDSMQLFGFSTEQERDVFLDLIRVSGIGPKQAQKILSGGNVEEFIRSVDSGDVDRLSALPGLGKKTAQKLVLALRGKLKFQDDEAGTEFGEIIEGLIGMGFDRKNAEKAVTQVSTTIDRTSYPVEMIEKEIFKQAIIRLSQ